MTLTPRQRQIYDFVRGFTREHGYAPSLEEIAAHLGLRSVATVHRHVAQLVAKGLVRKDPHRARAIELVPRAGESPAVRLPLLGEVAAGAPIEVFEVPDEISVPPELVRHPERSFVLRVRGESMIDEQIRDGDLVIVEAREDARSGETVVALVNGEQATLKRLERRGRRVRLVPANPTMAALELPAEAVAVRGVVRGLLRRYEPRGAR